MRKEMLYLIAAMVLIFAIPAAAKQYSYPDLVNMLVDLERIAQLPVPGEKCLQWSSYDRSSYYDEETGKYVNWDANGDGFGGKGWIRKEGGKLVLAEMEGPGCIWRIWSATPQDGHVRIYLDGSSTPAVDLPFIGYFNGENAPFDRDGLVHIVASGKNSYVPIPFAKSCRIVADSDYGEFHHFTYTLFPKGTKVPTFSRNLDAASLKVLDRVNEQVKKCGPKFLESHYRGTTAAKTITISPKERVSRFEIPGPAAIYSLIVKPQLPEEVDAQRQILRELELAIYWDGDDEPSVWTPLGDFFGTAPGINLYDSLPCGMTPQQMYSNWFMPFKDVAKIEFINSGDKEITLEYEISFTPLAAGVSKYGRFHAKWHRDAFLPKEPERQIDWTLLTTQGRGRFCGVSLEIWNPRGGWWGEGDEKFFVDGEKFPSTYGTGSEDYFGYAWSDPTLWEHAFHSQPISEGNKGHVNVSRWHIADNIPFQKSFEGYIEKYFSNERPTLYAATAYWYLDPSGHDPYKPFALEERTNWYPELKYPLEIAGILVQEKPVGAIEAQGMQTFTMDKWQKNDQLWWIGEMGAELKIALNAKKAGLYKITTRLTKAADYGIIQFALNGKTISEPMDMYFADGVIATDEIDLGLHELSAERHILSVKVVGINPDAIKRYMVGIDYVKIQEASFLDKLFGEKDREIKDQKSSQQARMLTPAAFTGQEEYIMPGGVLSRSISWENRKGEKGKGGMAAGPLGVGRKGSPCIGGIKSGSTATLMDIDGCGIIKHIWMTLPEREPQHLRNIIIRMYWENSDIPSVEVPLSDFFGTAHGRAVDMRSEYITVIKGKGFNCWFPMPFRKHAKITIENDMADNQEIGCLFFQIDYELHDKLPDNAGLFHAQFRRQNPTVPKQDYVLLENVQGPGCFFGCVIGIRTLEPHWWGEGEIKFYMDGDTDFPTICGTGTEDYFGGAWGMDLYQSDYLGCTVLEPGDAQVSMYRFHKTDPIYFQKDLKVTIQQIGWFPKGIGERSGDDWCSVVYWYQLDPVRYMPVLPDRKARTADIFLSE